MRGLVSLLVQLEGEGVVNADIKAITQLSGSLTGEGELVTPILKAIAWCIADLLGEGDADGSDLRSDGYMSANITSAGSLVTAQSCAAAVWSALAEMYTEDGTMGKAMSAAGSAGDPWSGILASYTDDATFGAFIKKLLTLDNFMALRK